MSWQNDLQILLYNGYAIIHVIHFCNWDYFMKLTLTMDFLNKEKRYSFNYGNSS